MTAKELPPVESFAQLLRDTICSGRFTEPSLLTATGADHAVTALMDWIARSCGYPTCSGTDSDILGFACGETA